jgi:hypothetical protein
MDPLHRAILLQQVYHEGRKLIIDTPPTTSPPPIPVPTTAEPRPVLVQATPTQNIIEPQPPSPWIDRALAVCIALLAAMILRKMA